MTQKTQSATFADGFTVVITPGGDVYMLCVADAARNKVLERVLGEEYSVYRVQDLPISDEIAAFASADECLLYNRWASELCHTDLHGTVILMPVENKQFVLWDYGKAEILQYVVSGEIKMRKNREEVVYGRDQT